MLSERELNEILDAQIAGSSYKDEKFQACNRELKNSYLQEPYGDELEGRSQVVASDHYELTESDLPTYARVFLGPNKIMTFRPFGEADREECEQKTKYADYLIRQQKDSFKVLLDWLKEPCFSKISVLKFYPDEEEVPEYHRYKDISEDELVRITKELETKGDSVEIVAQSTDEENGKYTIDFKVIKKVKKICIVNVPSHRFIISADAISKDDADITGDVCLERKDRLIALGYDEEKVRNLVPAGFTKSQYEDYKKRVLLNDGATASKQWLAEKVEVEYLYSRVDYDEDGRLERRMIVRSGNVILANEPYGISPYAINTQLPMPGKIIGRSRGEFAARTQKHKTALERSISDNIYAVSRPGYAIDDSEGDIEGGKVNIDDLINHDIERVVRVDGPPMQHIMPFVTTYIGDSALQIVQYLDAKKVSALGHYQANQGLDADKFYRETATRFEGIDESGKAKIELVCRVYAEIGFRQLYEGVIWTAQHYQDEEIEVMVLGEQLKVDPKGWKYEHYCMSDVGLGAGDSQSVIDNLAAQLNTQLALAQTRPELVDSVKIYNTLDDLARAMGKANTSRYYNNPEIPLEQLLPMLEQARGMVKQLQQQVSQNPLAEAELIKAQGKVASDQMKAQNDMQQFLMKMQQEQREFQQTLAKQLTELELKYNQNVPGSTV